MQDKTYDINIERSILSSLIFDPALFQTNSKNLSQSLFFLPVHQTIFNLLYDGFTEESPLDETLLLSIVGKEKEDEILNILSANPISNLSSYIELLADLRLKRDIQKLIQSLGNDLASSSGLELQSQLSLLSDSIQNSSSKALLEIDNIQTIEDKQTEFICKSWLPIPKRTVSLITAPGGTGKSWLVLQLAIRALQANDAKKVFLWLSEDPKEITKHRFNKVYNEVLNINEVGLKEKIDISDSPTIQFIYEDQRKVEISPLFQQFKAMVDGYDLIILDPLIAFYGVDENNNAHARRFMQLFTNWASKEDKTIIFIHHSTKNTTQSRGATAFVDAVRLVYELDKIRDKEGKVVDTNKREIKLTKDNYGASRLLDGFSFQRVLFPAQVKYETITSQTQAMETVAKVGQGDKYSFLHPDF